MPGTARITDIAGTSGSPPKPPVLVGQVDLTSLAVYNWVVL